MTLNQIFQETRLTTLLREKRSSLPPVDYGRKSLIAVFKASRSRIVSEPLQTTALTLNRVYHDEATRPTMPLFEERATSLKFIGGKGIHHISYIEHYSEGYLAFRDNRISCEPLKKEEENFVYRLAVYNAMKDSKSMVAAQTVCCQRRSGRELKKFYMCATDDKNISLQEMDFIQSPPLLPQDDRIVFIRRSLQSGFVCFESSKYPEHFLAVNEEDRVVLLPLNDLSAASEIPMVHFKCHFIH